MRVYFRYALKETFSNLWRNRMMTIAAILCVAVSLALVGSALLAQAKCGAGLGALATGHARHRLDGADCLDDGNQTACGPNWLICPLSRVATTSRQTQDYNEAKKLLPPNEWAVLTVSAMPSSFRCVPTVPSDAFLVQNTFYRPARHLPGDHAGLSDS